jgi:pimeloyl-ACP methyl ester carboxylesterase
VNRTSTPAPLPGTTPAPAAAAIAAGARARLLHGLPVAERRLSLAGISTALLEGGDGPPLVLLHGPAGNATHWMRVLPELVADHRVIAPDLPGQGESATEPPPDTAQLMAWLGELIARSCASPPVLVGYALGGAIAARFAIDHGGRLERLVLIDSFGLTALDPVQAFARAIEAYLTQPDERSHDELWRYCAHDRDSLRARLGEHWELFKAYNLDRARAPGTMAALGGLMAQFTIAIPELALASIAVPTALVWGRHDLATPLRVAEAASVRYGWPLHVIDDCADDPPVEQPEAFVRALRSILADAQPKARTRRKR